MTAPLLLDDEPSSPSGRWPAAAPRPPRPRGPLSERLLAAFQGPPRDFGVLVPQPGTDPLTDEDVQLSLYAAYELHYRGLAGVDEAWEWHPALRAAIGPLEAGFESALRRDVGQSASPSPEGTPVALKQALEEDQGRSLSTWMAERGTLEQLREFAVHRSAYQLKEADPHSWALPRLSGTAKAALVEIQADEYGRGEPGRSHAELFADTLHALGLDATYGTYLDRVPATTLATVNLITLFGLHRRLRGALVGHLAAFEMTSVIPMDRYASAFRRLGVGGHEFYDVHVEADAHHEKLASDRLAAGLVASEPNLGSEVLFGARAVTAVERRFADHLLDAWERGRSSLR